MLKPEPPINGSVSGERKSLAPPVLPAKAKRTKVKNIQHIWAPVIFSSFILPSRLHWMIQDMCWIRGRPKWFEKLPEFFHRPDVCVGVDCLSCRHRIPKNHSPTVPEGSDHDFVRGQRFFLSLSSVEIRDGTIEWSASVPSFTHPGFRPAGSLPEGQEHNLEL